MTRPSVAKIARLLLGFGMLTKGEQSAFIQQFNQFFMVSRKKQRQMMDQWLSESALDPTVTITPGVEDVSSEDKRASRPVVGTRDSLFIDLLVMPAEERRLSWIEDISHALYAVEPILSRSLTSLSDNPSFVSIFQEATHLAVRSSESRKLKALKRLVLNSALDEDVPEWIQQMYLAILAPMTGVHLSLLEWAHNARSVASADDAICNVGDDDGAGKAGWLPGQVDQTIIDRATRDLRAQGLLDFPGACSKSAGAHYWPDLSITEFGRRFLAFVS